jgi:hypothetical protein
MQAVALATNDEILVHYNLTIDAGDVLDYMQKLTYIWMDPSFSKHAEFDDMYIVYLSLVPGPSGYCYNFNMANASDLFHLDLYGHHLLLLNMRIRFNFSFRLPPNFNFIRSHFVNARLSKNRDFADNSTKTYPRSVSEYLSGYMSMVDFTSHWVDSKGGMQQKFYAFLLLTKLLIRKHRVPWNRSTRVV